MKKSIRNNERVSARLWWVTLGLVVLLTACTVKENEVPFEKDDAIEESDGIVKRDDAVIPNQSEHGDWQDPGLVDRTGAPIEVPTPDPTTGKTLDVTDFGADPDPDSQDDAAAIRAALDAAELGDEVFLPAGTYDLHSTDPNDKSANIVLRSGVDLRGEGQERTVLLTSLDGEDDSRVIRGSGIQDVIIADFTITSRHEGPLGDDPKDGDAGGGPMYGIYLGAHKGQASSRIIVENLSIRKFERHGISVKASREVTISENYISEATAVGPGGQGYGIAIEGTVDQHDPNATNDSRHNVVTGNTFDGRHLRHAILLQFRTHNNLVAENTIVGSILDAIDLHGEGEYLNEIRDNTVIGGQRAGIALGNPGGSKNKHDASGTGNWVHSNHLIGNREGILVMLGTPDTLIEDNRITAKGDSKTGIEIRNAPGTKLFRNYITGGNSGFWSIKLGEDRGNNGRGIGIPKGIRIEHNVIRQAANGIKINAGEDLSVIENVMDGIGGDKLKVDDGIKLRLVP
ncbi:right-handed parallel beta-helix repeat-containing protein [Sporosarcina thermotolerans]|uniref:Right-handed parallel beta-helix repeat-containing protein n=1 Tax=Sporosarcina thermotolerans TaxID=633404 RepID=A0AAW9A925_9BACL|nr:right-handed parallel beta-helix repeat-containing protein [Sporosarcina thermotolerans]MDW0116151.1 right-handed parallel beta-helix repeat-containing protein [Sporosarcina thermotolerans]WHT48122.1 right-handed parallel beta-helix repeat-containing protein [Sporosarcina thermotolerans]